MRNFSIFICFIFYISCSSQIKKNEKIQISDVKIFQDKSIRHQDTKYPYLIEIKLRNISNDTLRFWMFSCYWSGCFVFNNTFSSYGSCISNVPIVTELKPKQEITYSGTIGAIKLLEQKDLVNLGIAFKLYEISENDKIYMNSNGVKFGGLEVFYSINDSNQFLDLSKITRIPNDTIWYQNVIKLVNK